MLGREESDPLFLQVKEADESVLAAFAGASKYGNQGQRVVAGQRLMQASSDIFLDWQRIAAGLDRQLRDFYVRQLRDWKYSIAIEHLVPHGMQIYGEMCGWALAPAYACSGDRVAIASTSAARTCSSRRSPSSPVPTPTRATVTTNRLLTPPHRQMPATSAPRMKPGDLHAHGRAGAGHHPSPGRRHAARGGFRDRRYQEGAP